MASFFGRGAESTAAFFVCDLGWRRRFTQLNIAPPLGDKAEMLGFRNGVGSGGALACLCALFAVVLGGCSTVQSLSGAPHPGYQQTGDYVLSDQEQGLGCRALQERSLGLQEQMQKLSKSALEQVQELPYNCSLRLGSPVRPAGRRRPAIAEYKQAQAETAAVDATMVRKGCPIETASIKRCGLRADLV